MSTALPVSFPPPDLLTQSSPFAITSLRIEQGRKLHSNAARQNWELEPEGLAVFHQHSYYELVYVLEGEMTQHLENGVFRYQSGDALLLNRNIRHFEGAETDCDILFLCLDPSFLQELLQSNAIHPNRPQHSSPQISCFLLENEQPDSNALREYLDFACSLELRHHPEQNPAAALLNRLRDSLLHPGPGYACQLQADLLRLLALLEHPAQYHLSRIRVDASDEAFLYTRVLRYLESCHGHATRSELGEALHYNGDYLNRLVKRQSGKTILQLGQEICIRQAAQLLRESGQSISDIIEALGLVNRTHFYQLFQQQMGCSPMQYRKQYK